MTRYRIKKLGLKLYEVQKKVLWYWDDAFGYLAGPANRLRKLNRNFDSYHAATAYLEDYLAKKNEWKNVPKYFYPPFPDKEPE